MEDFVNELFDRPTGSGKLGDATNLKMLLRESIIRDMLGNDNSKVEALYESVGAYAARDGVLNEETELCCNSSVTDKLAILAAAKEANSTDYQTYVNALAVMNASFEKMKATYCNIAKDKIEEEKEVIMTNPRISENI